MATGSSISIRRRGFIIAVTVCTGLLLVMYERNTDSLGIFQFTSKEDVNLSSWYYQNPHNLSIIGRVFRLPHSLLSNIGFPITDFIQLNSTNVGDFVFATGSNKDFFHIDMDAIARVQALFHNYTIVFYDLSDGKLAIHEKKINQLCNVIYRRFNFDLYPAHVHNLHFYAWKPLIIHELLREYQGVFWFDSSVRFHTGNLSVTVGPAVSTGGVLTFTTGGLSVFSTTHDGMFKYLPMSKALAVNTTMREAGDSLFYRTEFAYTNIVSWWVLCALERNCIASTSALICKFKSRDTWAKCHRFDQSAFNILLANLFPYQPDSCPIYLNLAAGITVERGSRGKERLMICGTIKSEEHFAY